MKSFYKVLTLVASAALVAPFAVGVLQAYAGV